MMRRFAQRYGKDTSGSTAIEFAIIALVFVTLAIGIVDFGRNFHQQSRLAHAADVLARVVMLDPAAPDASLRSRMQATFPTLGYSDIAVSFGITVVGGRNYRVLDLSRPLMFFTPGLTDRSGTIRLRRLVPV
jgi:Flp pilus assembly protein TadG